MKSYIYGISLFAILLLSNNVQAACSGIIESAASVDLPNYDPFSPIHSRTPKTLQIQNTSDKDCNFNVYFVRNPPEGSFSDQLLYSITDRHDKDLLATTRVSHNAHPIGPTTIPPGSRSRIEYFVLIRRGQISRPAIFADSIEAVLTSADGQHELDRVSLSLSLEVKAVASLQLSGAGTSTSVDFGRLETGEQRFVRLEAQSNATYELSFTSANGGVMELEPPVLGQNWHVPYALTVDGASQTLKKPFTLDFNLSNDGESIHDLNFTILDADNKRAGTYKDVITVTVSPLY